MFFTIFLDNASESSGNVPFNMFLLDSLSALSKSFPRTKGQGHISAFAVAF